MLQKQHGRRIQSSSESDNRVSNAFCDFLGPEGATANSLSLFCAFRKATSSVPSEDLRMMVEWNERG